MVGYKEIHKIRFTIVAELIMFLQRSKILTKTVLRDLYLVWMIVFFSGKKLKYSASKKKLIVNLIVKIMTHIRSLRHYNVVNHLILLFVNVIC